MKYVALSKCEEDMVFSLLEVFPKSIHG